MLRIQILTSKLILGCDSSYWFQIFPCQPGLAEMERIQQGKEYQAWRWLCHLAMWPRKSTLLTVPSIDIL
jgi:hypothetical protein